jgi:putative ABC transport system permease protein
LRRIEAIPGITEVGSGSNIPFSGDHMDTLVRDVDDIDGVNGTAAAKADRRAVSSNYFRLLQMPLLRGRVFNSADGAKAHGVAIVNERLARALVSGGDVLGRRVRIGASANQPPFQIIGVVADARSAGTSVEVLNEIYIPYAQSSAMINYLIVQSALDSGRLAESLRREIRATAPELPLSDTQTATSMQELVHRSLAAPRFSATLISAFSATALLLSAMGVFGLVAYSVSRRRKEFGIRAALGAGPRDLTFAAIWSAVALTAVGVVFGLAAAAYITRFVGSQLYAIKPLDLPTFIGAAAVMLVVAGLAAYIPAKRAACIDPMTALRYE